MHLPQPTVFLFQTAMIKSKLQIGCIKYDQQSGFVPNSDLNRKTVNLYLHSSKVQENFTVSTDLSYTNNWSDNRPSTQERGANPLQWAASTPPNVDIRKLEKIMIWAEVVLKIGVQDWEILIIWLTESTTVSTGNRFMGNVQATWEITPKLSFMGRWH